MTCLVPYALKPTARITLYGAAMCQLAMCGRPYHHPCVICCKDIPDFSVAADSPEGGLSKQVKKAAALAGMGGKQRQEKETAATKITPTTTKCNKKKRQRQQYEKS